MASEYRPNWRHESPLDQKRCKASVWVSEGRGSSSHQCYSKPQRAGWCMVHPPDSEKIRSEKGTKLFNEKMAKRLAPYRALDFVREIANEGCLLRNKAADPVALDCFEANRMPCISCRARAILEGKA